MGNTIIIIINNKRFQTQPSVSQVKMVTDPLVKKCQPKLKKLGMKCATIMKCKLNAKFY